MIGRQDRWQEDLFVACSLRDLVPDDHILKRVDKVLDLSWLRDAVKECYCSDNGRPGIDPEVAVRLMLAGLFQGIVHDRKLLREAQVNLAMRWFIGYRLDEKLPDHSSLTRIRQRWGPARFKRIFERTVGQCVSLGLVGGDILHVDATLIRADVSWESLVARHADEVVSANGDTSSVAKDDSDESHPVKSKKKSKKKSKCKKVSRTDPDATLTTSNKHSRMEPSFKQHTGVDDKCGVIVDAHVTTGEASEGQQLPDQIDRVEKLLNTEIDTVTADSGYAHGSNYGHLLREDITQVIPPQRLSGGRRKTLPLIKFKYDAINETVTCPAGRKMKSGKTSDKGTWYRGKARHCQQCPLRDRCVPPSAKRRSVLIAKEYVALTRARREHAQGWPENKRDLYNRHRWLVEGVHGRAKTQHGLRRAARRGLANVRIQAYLTAAAMNLKRLAAALRFILTLSTGPEAAHRPYSACSPNHSPIRPSAYAQTPNLRTAA